MKVVMTLLVRDEADIVESWLAFHLNAGADFVVATDNLSRDGTSEILQSYADKGLVHVIQEPGEDLRDGEWTTRMARLAAAEFGADWVINSDADEFWWPRGGSLKRVLSAIPERYGIVSAFLRTFAPRPGHGAFAERMTIRFSASRADQRPEPAVSTDSQGGPTGRPRDHPRTRPSCGAGHRPRAAARLVSDRVVPLSAAKPGAVRAQGSCDGNCVRASHRQVEHGLPRRDVRRAALGSD